MGRPARRDGLEELEEHDAIPEPYPCGKYLLTFDPLDGSADIDVNVAVGSIFSILRTTRRLAGTPGQTLTWDAEGNVDSITGSAGTTTLVHTADGERLLRRDPATTTLYLNDTEVVLTRARSRSVRPYPSRTFTTGAQTIASTRSYRLDGETIALRTASGVTTLISDRHGTTELAIAKRDNTLLRRRSLPFGGGRGPTVSWPGTKGFLGGTRDPTGLVHLGDRLYDPTTGQFLSPDREVDHRRPQQVNGYAYAVHPATVTDPLGADDDDPPAED